MFIYRFGPVSSGGFWVASSSFALRIRLQSATHVWSLWRPL